MRLEDLEAHLEQVVSHYDARSDYLTSQECLHELDQINDMVSAAYLKLGRRQQESRPQSTPVGVGSSLIGRKVR